MAHTSEQAKEGAQDSATTGSNVPAASTASQQTPAMATSTSQNPELEDKEYDPSAEALIDEIDDERTLEEEEALAGDNTTAVQNELDDLKRESEMPIEELLAYYQRMREQEGAQEGEDEEEEEESGEEDDEEDEMEDEDEVRKTQSASTGVKKDGHVEQQSPKQRLPTDDQSNQQQRAPSTATSQTTSQVNPSLSNSHLLSPPKPSKINAQPQQNAAELKDIPKQDTQTSVVNSDGSQQPQQSNLVQNQNPQISQTQIQTSAPPSTVQEQNLNVDRVDESAVHLQDNDAQSIDLPTARHRHSMTEFLVETDTSGSLLKTFLDYDLDDSDDLDEDYSYTDDENVDDERDWRRVIHVGPEHQAEVPETLSAYENDLPPYENPDTLVWRCSHDQTKEELIDYLKRASTIPRRTDLSLSPASVPGITNHDMRLYRERVHDMHGNIGTQTGEINHENALNPHENLRDVYMSQSRKRLKIESELEQENAMDGLNQPLGDAGWIDPAYSSTRDENSNSVSQDTRPDMSPEEYIHAEEQLLFLLLQCNHDCEEALRRRRLDPFKYYFAEPMTLWSQDECMNFENGLRTYGKNFHLIRETKVPTRTRAEVVAFYYLWKKSERHDVYTTQYKIDRKRSLTHPGITDYMDKFIEDNESALNASSTHTPTPTECTVEVNQASEPNHDPLVSSKCREPDIQSSLSCPNIPEDQPLQPRETMNQGMNGEEPSQENEIYLDGSTAIE